MTNAISAAEVPAVLPSGKGWVIRHGPGGYWLFQVGVKDPAGPYGPKEHPLAIQWCDALNGVPS